MSLVRRRISTRNPKVAGTGGGTGGVTASVVWGPKFGNTDLAAAASTALTKLSTLFSGLSATASTGLGQFTSLFSAITATSSVDKSTWTANYDYGASSVSQTGTTGNGWASTGNATGLHNGTNSTLTGSATAAQAGQLNFTYPSQDGNGFTISSVNLKFYTGQSGTTLSNGNLVHKWGIGNTNTTLQTFTGNVTNTPATYDITSTIAGSWTNVTSIQTAVSASYGIANTSVATCDAVEVVIVASF